MIGLVFAAALALNPLVTQATINQTICKPGWATAQRAMLLPQKVSEPIKRRMVYALYGRTAHLGDYILDHKEPIYLGGAVDNPANFMIQTKADAKRKDGEERHLHSAVCYTHTMTLKQAQRQMAKDWS